MSSQADPLALKLRTTLFEIRKKGFGTLRQGCTHGPILGVTFTNRLYKTRRQQTYRQAHHQNQTQTQSNRPNQSSFRENDENQLK